ncbi:DsbC family protein [Oryzomonas japonica]|uniref:DsbC family protein n=2 Tax=Oryzomonas japonica TaxID=2603858 RepID=A0A7J4ZPJ7_9BACT|nr:DsbC family protein [Oryzomonas japonica]
MNLKNYIAIGTMLLLSFPTMVLAHESAVRGDCTSCHTLSPAEATQLLKKGGGTVKSVKQAPNRGMFELLVEKDGREGIVYLDYGKKFLIQGLVLGLDTFEPVASHGTPALQPKKIATINPVSVPDQYALNLGNPDGVKRLYVFTDPDCPYCRNLHGELKKLEKLAPELSIRVMLFPLPIHQGAYDKARVILGRKSRALLDAAFDGKDLPQPVGDEGKVQLDAIMGFAYAHGLTGTPTIVFPDGSVVVGIRDAVTLKSLLERM